MATIDTAWWAREQEVLDLMHMYRRTLNGHLYDRRGMAIGRAALPLHLQEYYLVFAGHLRENANMRYFIDGQDGYCLEGQQLYHWPPRARAGWSMARNLPKGAKEWRPSQSDS